MKSIISTIIALMLVGCGSSVEPEVIAANILRTQMKAPDSFIVKQSKLMWEGVDAQQRPAYIVKIVYTAMNTYGANLQYCNLVGFSQDDTKVYWKTGAGIKKCEHQIFSPEQITEIMSKTIFMF